MLKMTIAGRTMMSLALALLPLAAGCTTAPTPTPTPTASATPALTAPTISPEEQDLENAKDAVRRLWAVVDRLTNDPDSSIQELDEVASGEALEFFRTNLTGYRLEQLIGSGNSVLEFQAAEASGKNEQALATWTVTTCVDASNTTLVDKDGTSVTAPPYRVVHRSTIVERSATLKVDDDEVTGTC